jgi:adenylylsulfate kinase-like enzyme
MSMEKTTSNLVWPRDMAGSATDSIEKALAEKLEVMSSTSALIDGQLCNPSQTVKDLKHSSPV